MPFVYGFLQIFTSSQGRTVARNSQTELSCISGGMARGLCNGCSMVLEAVIDRDFLRLGTPLF